MYLLLGYKHSLLDNNYIRIFKNLAVFAFLKRNKEDTTQAAALKPSSKGPAPVQKTTPAYQSKPTLGAFSDEASRQVVRDDLIHSGIANGQLSEAKVLNPAELTPDLTVALVLRRGREALVFHPGIKGVDLKSVRYTLKTLNSLDGLYSTSPEQLAIDLYLPLLENTDVRQNVMPPKGRPDTSAPARNVFQPGVWVEERFKHRGIDPELHIEPALKGNAGALLPCSKYSEALKHPHGVGTIQGVAGGIYAYINLGLNRVAEGTKVLSEKQLNVLNAAINQVAKDDLVTLGYEAVKDEQAILESPFYSGQRGEIDEDNVEYGGKEKNPAGGKLGFKALMPNVFIREDIYLALKTLLKAQQKAK